METSPMMAKLPLPENEFPIFKRNSNRITVVEVPLQHLNSQWVKKYPAGSSAGADVPRRPDQIHVLPVPRSQIQ